MYDPLRKEAYWPQMATEVNATKCDCRSGAQNLVNGKRRRQLKLLILNWRFEYGGMNIHGPLPNTKQGSLFVVVMTIRYTKMAEAIPTPTTKTTTVAGIVSEPCVASFDISSTPLTDNGSQFESNVFVAVCSTLRVNNITTFKYLLQTNDQVERFNSTNVSRLHHFFSEYQKRLGHSPVLTDIRKQYTSTPIF